MYYPIVFIIFMALMAVPALKHCMWGIAVVLAPLLFYSCKRRYSRADIWIILVMVAAALGTVIYAGFWL